MNVFIFSVLFFFFFILFLSQNTKNPYSSVSFCGTKLKIWGCCCWQSSHAQVSILSLFHTNDKQVYKYIYIIYVHIHILYIFIYIIYVYIFIYRESWLSVCSVYVLKKCVCGVSGWVWYIKTRQFRSIIHSKLTTGVTLNVNCCLAPGQLSRV